MLSLLLSPRTVLLKLETISPSSLRMLATLLEYRSACRSFIVFENDSAYIHTCWLIGLWLRFFSTPFKCSQTTLTEIISILNRRDLRYRSC